MVKSKRVRNKWKKNLFSTIRFKLAGSYCLLIVFIIVAGVEAYTSVFGTIKINYKHLPRICRTCRENFKCKG